MREENSVADKAEPAAEEDKTLAEGGNTKKEINEGLTFQFWGPGIDLQLIGFAPRPPGPGPGARGHAVELISSGACNCPRCIRPFILRGLQL